MNRYTFVELLCFRRKFKCFVIHIELIQTLKALIIVWPISLSWNKSQIICSLLNHSSIKWENLDGIFVNMFSRLFYTKKLILRIKRRLRLERAQEKFFNSASKLQSKVSFHKSDLDKGVSSQTLIRRLKIGESSKTWSVKKERNDARRPFHISNSSLSVCIREFLTFHHVIALCGRARTIFYVKSVE